MDFSVGHPDYPPASPIPSARYWESAENASVDCRLCPQRCRIASGRTGRCGGRRNDAGRLVLPYYGRYCSLAIDPIEKKPLYHFYPGRSILSIGSVGCNLSCRFCQNWQISQPGDQIPPLSEISPKNFASLAREKKTPLVAFTYNEPSISVEFVLDAAAECHAAGIQTVAVTNGMITGQARRDFYASMDAANIDLKSFAPDFYRSLCGGDLDSVKETIRYVAQETNVWLELTTLLIPGKNDSPDEIRAMAEWVTATVGPDVPLHFSAFFPTFRLTDAPRTPPETLFRAMKIAKDAGIRFVYGGNIADRKSQTTFCPDCGHPVIDRSGYRTESHVYVALPAEGESGENGGFCPDCSARIPGRF